MATFNQSGQSVGTQVNGETVVLHDIAGAGVSTAGSSLTESLGSLLTAVEELRRKGNISPEQHSEAIGVLREALEVEAGDAPDRKARLATLLSKLRAVLGGAAAVAPLVTAVAGIVALVSGGQP
jgi:hypothetical protein